MALEVLLPLLLDIGLPSSAPGMIVVSLFIGAFIAGITFAVAYARQSPEYHAVAKEELAALIFSLFIVVFWIGSDAIFNPLAAGLLQATLPVEAGAMANTPNVRQLSGGYITGHVDLSLVSLELLGKQLERQYVDLYLYEALIGFLSTISFPLGSPNTPLAIISFSIAPFAGLSLLSNAHTIVVEAIGYLLTVLWAKQFILMFARDAVPLLLLPLGLVLRAVPFFRTTGSSIIALCFAAYFVLPFAVLLSNFLIFDAYKPAVFSYTPASASFFKTNREAGEWDTMLNEGQNTAPKKLLDQFKTQDVAEKASSIDECAGNWWVHLMCSAENIYDNIKNAFVGFVDAVSSIWWFMMGFTGDFFYSGLNNPLMPASASAGLYYFLIDEVSTISPFLVLVMFTTVMEIIITVTMYRNISLLLGGESELIGITKIV